MTKYTLVTLDGQQTINCLEHQPVIVKAIFESMDDEDDLFIAEDGFTTALVPTDDELNSINSQLASHGLVAHIQQ